MLGVQCKLDLHILPRFARIGNISNCRKFIQYFDPIPPVDKLKLYRAYYGDQLAIIFTLLELNSSPKDLGHNVSCIISSNTKIVNFGKNPNEGYMWIPPASNRDESQFSIDSMS